MANRTIAAFKAAFNAIFADNTSAQISEQDMRDFVTDIGDSFVSLQDGQSITGRKNFVEERTNFFGTGTGTTNQCYILFADSLQIQSGLVGEFSSSNRDLYVRALFSNLRLESASGTMIIPIKTTTERNGLTAEEGMLHYNDTDNKPEFYNGSSWVQLVDSASVELFQSTGTSIQFDRARKYGYPTAETGNITFDFTNAVEGVTQVLRHNSGTKPTMPSSAKKLSGTYVVSVNNIIYLTAYKESTGPDVWKVDVTVSQEATW